MEIKGNTEEIITKLRTIMVSMWEQEYESNPAFKVCNSGAVKPTDVENRWFNTTRHTYKSDDELIQAMATRLKQAGYDVEANNA